MSPAEASGTGTGGEDPPSGFGGGDRLAAAAAFGPVLLLLALWLVWASRSGGYFPRDWYPVAILLVAVIGVELAAGWRLPASRAARLALGLLAALVGWSFLSILWADAPGGAIESSGKLLLYLTAATVLALVPWTAGRVAWLLGVWALGAAGVGLVTLVGAAGAADPSSYFIEARFAEPLGYAGGSGALAALGVWPALALSSWRRTPLPLRPPLLALAVVLVQLTALPQSRGAFLGLAATAPLLLWLSPDRGRLAVRMLVGGGILALTLGPVLDVFSAAADGAARPALDEALDAVGMGALLATAAGIPIALVESRWTPSPRLRAGARRVIAGALTTLAFTTAAFALVNAGRVTSSVSDRWDSFQQGEDDSAEGDSRLTSTGDPQRYDYWRVAARLTRDSPLAGVGAGSFGINYTALRENPKHSRYPHDVWLRLSSELGLVGMALLLGFAAAAAWGLVAAGRRVEPARGALTAVALASLAYLLAHASIDWVEEFPAVAILPLGLVFAALGAAAPPARAGGRPAGRLSGRAGSALRSAAERLPRRALLVAAGALVALATFAALIAPYLSLRFLERAETRWRADPAASFRDLDRAKALSPLWVDPHLQEGAIAVELGDHARAARAFRDALDVQASWYAHLELAAIASGRGRFARAREEVAAARRLNPADPLVETVARRLRAGREVDPAAVPRSIRRTALERFYRLR